MTDEERLLLIERVYSNLEMICQVGASHRDPHEEQARVFNREIHRLIAIDLDMKEWLIPEEVIKPSYGKTELSSGELVQLKRVTAEQFFLRANPARAFLASEIERRRNKISIDDSMTNEPPLDPSEVWVIYGRDEAFRRTICDLLRTTGLRPIEFETAVARCGSGSPIVLDVVLREIRRAPAIVSQLKPDDYAELREQLCAEPVDAEENKDAGFQPRPNVILETGMALAALRDKTILVTKGQLREISDILGVHAVRWDGTPTTRNVLISRLEAMGCPVNRTGSDWLDES